PTSMESVTGTSRMTSRLRSAPAAAALSSFRLSNSATRVSAALAFMGFSALVGGQEMGGARFAAADVALDPQGMLAARVAERPSDDGHLLRQQGHHAAEVARQKIAG